MSPQDDMGGMAGYDWQTPRMLEAEAEVRRLHAQSQADEELMREVRDAMDLLIREAEALLSAYNGAQIAAGWNMSEEDPSVASSRAALSRLRQRIGE